jgi:hypothetical protein
MIFEILARDSCHIGHATGRQESGYLGFQSIFLPQGRLIS